MKLYKDFMYDEDTVINSLERSMEELKKAKLDLPGPPSRDEMPLRAFGEFIEPTFEQIVGRRTEKFSEKEKETNELVTMRSEATKEAVENDRDENRESQLSVGDSAGLTGTDADTNSVHSKLTLCSSKSSLCESTSSSIECTRL